MREHIVQGRIQQPYGHRPVLHDSEDFFKILFLVRFQHLQRLIALLIVICDYHADKIVYPFFAEKHICPGASHGPYPIFRNIESLCKAGYHLLGGYGHFCIFSVSSVYILNIVTGFHAAEPEAPEVDQRGAGDVEHAVRPARHLHRLLEHLAKPGVDLDRLVAVHLRDDGVGVRTG